MPSQPESPLLNGRDASPVPPAPRVPKMIIRPMVQSVYRPEYDPALDLVVGYIPPEDLLLRTMVPSTLVPQGVFVSIMASQ